jgi:hypothetical protein
MTPLNPDDPPADEFELVIEPADLIAMDRAEAEMAERHARACERDDAPITAIVPVRAGVDVEELRAARKMLVELGPNPLLAKLLRHLENAVGPEAWEASAP